MDECEIVKMTDDEIVVQHRGQQSSFVIAHDANGRRQLPASDAVLGPQFESSDEGEVLWTFAFQEALKAGKIDH